VSRCGWKVETELKIVNGSVLAAAVDDSDTAAEGAREELDRSVKSHKVFNAEIVYDRFSLYPPSG